MIKVVDQIECRQYTVITLNEKPPWHWKDICMIDGQTYHTEIVYDMPNSIALIGKGNFVGKEIIFPETKQ